jgi:hypothetical protein
VVGKGGREHAIALALRQDPAVGALYVAPGNPGTAAVAENRPVDMNSGAAVADLASGLGADLVVVGPEAPLVAGVADAVRARGLACFGPDAAAARLEGSKAFAKEIMTAAVPGLPGATYSAPTAGSWRNAKAMACSRPPLPTTSTVSPVVGSLFGTGPTVTSSTTSGKPTEGGRGGRTPARRRDRLQPVGPGHSSSEQLRAGR